MVYLFKLSLCNKRDKELTFFNYLTLKYKKMAKLLTPANESGLKLTPTRWMDLDGEQRLDAISLMASLEGETPERIEQEINDGLAVGDIYNFYTDDGEVVLQCIMPELITVKVKISCQKWGWNIRSNDMSVAVGALSADELIAYCNNNRLSVQNKHAMVGKYANQLWY